MPRHELDGPTGKGPAKIRGRTVGANDEKTRSGGVQFGLLMCTQCGYSESAENASTVKMHKCPQCGGIMIRRV